MSFTWFADKPLLTREQWMRVFIEVADELDMPDRRGACICAAMCAFQEAGGDPHKTGQRQIWIPGNNNDPAFRADPNRFRHDSMGDDGASVGPFQQQAGANWGWGGNLGDPEGTRKRMDPRESTRMFMGHAASGLKRKGYNASNAQTAGDSIQRVQGSSFPRAYDKWWDEANRLYDAVKGNPAPPPPAPAAYGMPRGSNSGGYGGNGVRFPDWVYALGNAFGLKPSTYPGHQESDRNEAGYAPNPQRLNRGIDWAAPGAPDEIDRMTRFADYLATIPQHLEQVIWQNPKTMRSIEVAGGRHQPGYFRSDLPGHRNHVHTRQSKPIPLPGGVPAPQPAKQVGWKGDPIWLPDVLRAAGLVCHIYPGAFERGHGDMGQIWGVMVHHTGSFGETPKGIAEHPSLGLASQLYLGRNGEYTLCGVGKAWHGGAGSYPGISDVNGQLIGIEAANDGGGTPGKPHRSSWSDTQYDAYIRGVAAILNKLSFGADRVIGHKEWAGKSQGKWDPGAIDMNIFRADVAARLQTPPTQGDDDLTPEQDQMLRTIFREQTQRHPSRSPLRHLGEGAVDTVAGFVLNADGSQHVEIVKLLASLGHPESLALLREVASADPAKYPDRQSDRLIAQAILAEIASTPTPASVSASSAYPLDDGELARLREENMRLREENMRLQQQAAVAQPSAELATVGAQEAKTSGQRVGALVDTVEDWTELALSMDVKQRAALAASLKVLQIQQNGSQP